jgi:hypothetical protein
MFDLIATGHRSRTSGGIVPLLTSWAIHATVIGAVVVVPLLYATDRLPDAPSEVLAFVAPPPPAPPPPPPPPAPRHGNGRRESRGRYSSAPFPRRRRIRSRRRSKRSRLPTWRSTMKASSVASRVACPAV